MITTKISLMLTILALGACASSPPPEAASAPTAPETSAASESPEKPDIAAAKKHLAEHVTYPATREQILAACADTPEFSAGEKRWISDNLPEGTYASADQVAGALKL